MSDDSPASKTSPAAGPVPWDGLRILSVLCLVVITLATPFVASTAVSSWRNNNNDLISWADDELPTKQQFRRFVDSFGRPELVVLSWPDCREDSTELANLKDAVTAVGTDWFDNVNTSASVLERLSDTPGRPSNERIRAQLQGVLFGEKNQACLILELGATAREQRPQAIQQLREKAKAAGVPSDDLRIGGIGAELAALDYESVAAPARRTPVVALIMLVLCTVFLRSLLTGLFMTAMGAFTGFLAAAVIDWCGVQSNAVLATLPTLGGLLSISLGLHFIGYYRNALTSASCGRDALRQAYRWAIKPTLISALTTVFGLGSLTLSRTLTIRQFGLFGALITGCAAVIALTAVPSFLNLRDAGRRNCRLPERHPGWQRLADFISKRAFGIICLIGVAVIVAGLGLSRLRTGVHVDSLFRSDHRIIRDEQWLETAIGPLSSLEVVITFPPAPDAADQSRSRSREITQQMFVVQRVETALRSTDRFHMLVSAATGIVDLDEIRSLKRLATTARIRKWVDENYEELCSSGFFSTSAAGNQWRISVRTPTMTSERTTDIRNALEDELQTILPAAQNQTRPSFFITGLPLLFEQIEQQFVEDLLITYVGGLILISVTVLVVLRSFRDAATAMIPNVLPAVGVLGGISLLGIKLDVGSVMTASIALGVAVDDTLHFILWFQRQRREGMSAAAAVKSSVQHCGSAILQTSVICGTGLAVLGTAAFLPTARFGLLIALMLGVALIGDLLFLPSMLTVRDHKESETAETVD